MGPAALSGVHTVTVQVASLISPTRPLQLDVPWRVGAGGQCWCDERVLPVHGPPAADYDQVPNLELPDHTLKDPTNRFLLMAAPEFLPNTTPPLHCPPSTTQYAQE